jgi:two-component system, NtrC family, sensor kinase
MDGVDRVDPPDLERISEACERLGATLIHEIRHPLLGIKAGLELLARSGGDAVNGSADFRMVRLQAGRLEELLRSYQQLFSRETPECEEFALAPVVRRSIELLDHRLAKLGTRFSLGEDAAARGWGASSAVLHALMNLLANALDAVEQGGTEGRIAVRVLAHAEGGAEVRVTDEGPGIPEEHRQRLFTTSFTTKAAGKGSGLGLQIARTLMTRFGGDVLLVPEGDPLRLPWATEFGIRVPPAPL